MQWIYADESEVQHEFPEEEFPALVASGRITRETLVWNETLPNWKTSLEARPDLFGGPPAPPLLTPSQLRQVRSSAPEPVGGTPPIDAVAICALVFGILGVLCLQIFAIPAIICGHIGLRRANENPGNSSNKGFSLTGIITGYIALLLLILIVAFYGAAIFLGMSEAAGAGE